MRLSNTAKFLSQNILYKSKKDIIQNWEKSEYSVIPFFNIKKNLTIPTSLFDKLL